MPNRLATAISPYLRSHADNPVDWHGWGAEAFAEARARDLPVLVSIGYSTCHWCHVMARESFSDPDLAAYLNEHFVSIKVDREEHPDVDASYLAAAGAFIEGLGWPLNVFVTPDGRAFHAGTYFPPRPMRGQPAFRQVLEAVTEAWTTRRDEVTASAALLSAAITEGTRQHRGGGSLPDAATLGRTVAELAAYEDTTHGGFGGAPKFPAAPALAFLLAQPADGPAAGQALALRALKRMGASPLRDPVEGGFFRYAVNRDWSEPHYERMLYDNAQLLELYTRAWQVTGEQWARSVAEGVADFLITVMQLPGGGFASAQDSESTVDGHRVEGGYYALDAEGRAGETPPALDAKVLTGWNGLAIAALSLAGFAFDNDTFTGAARRAADFLLEHHLPKRGPHDRGTLVRASIDDRVSTAPATLEDYGMFAHGLLHLALLTGESGYATAARGLIDSTLIPATDSPAPADVPPLAQPFTAPNGPDPVLAAQGLALDADPSEGAYPSGLSATADAAELLYLLTAERRYRATAEHAMGTLTALAPARPLAFGAALRLIAQLAAPVEQLVVITPAAAPGREPEDPAGLLAAVRRRGSGLVASVTEAQASAFAASGFELFAERTARAGAPTAYLCRDFVCRLPVTDPAGLDPAGGRP